VRSKHRKTYEAVLKKPTLTNIKWTDVESLLVAFGAEITEGSGSRIRIKLNNVRLVFHTPHPQIEMGKGRVEAIRDFLRNAGVKP